jgi:putative endonuclease
MEDQAVPWNVKVSMDVNREKRLKKWNREWKIRLIESVNPDWNDLSESLIGMP